MVMYQARSPRTQYFPGRYKFTAPKYGTTPRTIIASTARRRPGYRLPRNYRTGGFIGNELKFYDSYRASISVAGTVAGSEVDPATELCLNSMVQDDSENERQGRMCYFTSLEIRGWVLFAATAGGSAPSVPGYVRILVVKDTQTNKAQFNAEDVLAEPDATVGSEALRNLEHLQRFRILKDFTVKQSIYSGVGTAADSDWTGQQVPWKCNLKLKLKTLYTGTAGTVANILDNSIHVMAIHQGSTSPTMAYQARVRFYT